MTGEFSIQFLAARQGDAIWIRWGDGHQILIDLGTRATGRAIRKRLSEGREKDRAFDLLVVTHIDTDHIGGVMSGFVEAKPSLPPVTFSDIWFNGWDHLHGRKSTLLEGMGVRDGEKLAEWLGSRPWNEEFNRGPVGRGTTVFPTVTLPDGLTLTILGPSKQRLVELQKTWTEQLHNALRTNPRRPRKSKLEAMGTGVDLVLDTKDQLRLLAESETGIDGSEANGASICLLLEHGTTRVLLTGDGFSDDITGALQELAKQRAELLDERSGRIRLDLIKVPHHGSQNNLSRALVDSVTCPRWLFSSDGTSYKHPDPPAVARILAWGTPKPILMFTESTDFTRRWDRGEWMARHRYLVEYGTKEDGLKWTV